MLSFFFSGLKIKRTINAASSSSPNDRRVSEPHVTNAVVIKEEPIDEDEEVLTYSIELLDEIEEKDVPIKLEEMFDLLPSHQETADDDEN